MNYIKKEFKKLGGIILIGVGAFLIIEHIYTYGRINFFDFLGHEWFGMYFIVAGLLLANQWSQSFSEAWKETKDKLKYVFGSK